MCWLEQTTENLKSKSTVNCSVLREGLQRQHRSSNGKGSKDPLYFLPPFLLASPPKTKPKEAKGTQQHLSSILAAIARISVKEKSVIFFVSELNLGSVYMSFSGERVKSLLGDCTQKRKYQSGTKSLFSHGPSY